MTYQFTFTPKWVGRIGMNPRKEIEGPEEHGMGKWPHVSFGDLKMGNKKPSNEISPYQSTG